VIGHVDGKDDDADDLALFVAQRDLVGAHPALFSGADRDLLEDPELRLPEADHLEVVAVVLSGLVGVEVVRRRADQVGGTFADRLGRGTVGPQDAVLRVLVPDHGGNRVENGFELLALPAEHLLESRILDDLAGFRALRSDFRSHVRPSPRPCPVAHLDP
jgi:hypothetical protein